MKEILLCEPRHYALEYEINPWMKLENQPQMDLAQSQWRTLQNQLLSEGVKLSFLEPQTGVPDLVFTANGALIHQGEAVLSRFRYRERQREEPHFQQWLLERQFTLHRLPEGQCFEGEGDALFWAGDLIAGYGFRSDLDSHQWIAKLWGLHCISLCLVDPRFYHLDTCFCPLNDHLALYYPPAFDSYAQRALQGLDRELIAVNEADALAFCCNALVLGNRVILQHCSRELKALLQSYGFDLVQLDFSEFMKAGGSAKCLSLTLQG